MSGILKSAGPQGDATIYVSTRDVDRDGDVVMPSGWDVKMYQENPVGLWSHRNDMPAIFKALETKADSYGLMQVIEFADTEHAQEIKKLFVGGFLKTFSAGFRGVKSLWRNNPGQAKEFADTMLDCEQDWPEFKPNRDKVQRVIQEQVLFESSLCNIPANPFAMVQAIHKKTLAVSEWMHKELKVEEYIKKAMDAGVIEPKTIVTKPPEAPQKPAGDLKTAAPSPAIPPAPAAPVTAHPVTEIKEFCRITEHTSDPFPAMVQAALKKSLAKIRGAI